MAMLEELQRAHVDADTAWRVAVAAATDRPGPDTAAALDAAREACLDATRAYHAAKMDQYEAPARRALSRVTTSRTTELAALRARIAELEKDGA